MALAMRLLLLTTALTSALPFVARGEVLALTTNSFDETVMTTSHLLVLFYDPGCGHCRMLLPEWESAAQRLHGKVLVAKVDATSQRALARKYNLDRMPAMKLFFYGAPVDYTGGRRAAEIVQAAEKRIAEQSPFLDLLSWLPARWPFRSTSPATFADLRQQRPYGSLAYAASNLVYLLAGAVGLLVGSEPRLLCWLLCQLGMTSLLSNVTFLGQPLVGLILPCNTAFLCTSCGMVTQRLLVFLQRRPDDVTLWVALALAVVAACLLHAGTMDLQAGDRDAFMLRGGVGRVFSGVVASAILARCRRSRAVWKVD